jgi:hypothetical protein
MNTQPDVIAWMNQFSTAVCERDFTAGRKLFSPNVRSFGTLADDIHDLVSLVDRQWSITWQKTQHFEFEPDSTTCHVSDNGCTAIVISKWSSQRSSDGGLRQGRSTIVLVREDIADAWVAIHSHFSMTPLDGGQLD